MNTIDRPIASLALVVIFMASCGMERIDRQGQIRAAYLSAMTHKTEASTMEEAPDKAFFSQVTPRNAKTQGIEQQEEEPILAAMPYYCDPMRYAPSIVTSARQCKRYLKQIYALMNQQPLLPPLLIDGGNERHPHYGRWHDAEDLGRVYREQPGYQGRYAQEQGSYGRWWYQSGINTFNRDYINKHVPRQQGHPGERFKIQSLMP